MRQNHEWFTLKLFINLHQPDFHRLKELDEANRLDVTTTRTKSARCTTWSNVEVMFKTFSNSPEQIKILQSFPWVGDLKLPCVRFDKASKVEPANTSFRGIFGHYGEKEMRIFMLLFKKPNSCLFEYLDRPLCQVFFSIALERSRKYIQYDFLW